MSQAKYGRNVLWCGLLGALVISGSKFGIAAVALWKVKTVTSLMSVNLSGLTPALPSPDTLYQFNKTLDHLNQTWRTGMSEGFTLLFFAVAFAYALFALRPMPVKGTEGKNPVP